MEKLFENFSEYLENINEKYTDDAKSSNDPELIQIKKELSTWCKKYTDSYDSILSMSPQRFPKIKLVTGNRKMLEVSSPPEEMTSIVHYLVTQGKILTNVGTQKLTGKNINGSTIKLDEIDWQEVLDMYNGKGKRMVGKIKHV